MQTSRLVLFDIDGTLLLSAGCGRAATRLALLETYGTYGALDSINFAGKTDWQIMLETLQPVGISADRIRANIPHYNQILARIMDDIIGDFPVQPCVGAREVVSRLCQHPDVLLGLVTGNMQGIVSAKLRAAGYDPADFKVGAYGSEGWERAMLPPLALDRAHAFDSRTFSGKQIVIIGDTPGDIACAASVGGRTIAVATGPFSLEELRAHQPDFTFETLADTDAVLAAIFARLDRAG